MLAAISLDFDPSTSLFGLSIQLETLALAGVVFFALLLAALRSDKSRFLFGTLVGEGAAVAASSFFQVPLLQTIAVCVAVPPLVFVLQTLGAGRLPPNLLRWKAIDDEAPKLRRDDLILIAFGAIPGAVVGGRLSYVLMHLDYYRANTSAITDPGQGGFGLTLAVVLGSATAVAVARLLAAPISRWLGAASVPLLLGLSLGKVTMVLGGVGQGNYSGASWATAYVGQGPWGSTNPSFPSIPSQAVEGGLLLVVAVPLLVLPFALRLRVRWWKYILRPGLATWRDSYFLSGYRRFLLVIGLWAVVRFAVESTWRDAPLKYGLSADQIVLLVVAVAAGLGILVPMVLGALHKGFVAGVAHVTSHNAAGAAAGAREVLAEPKGLSGLPIGPAEPKGLPPSEADRPGRML